MSKILNKNDIVPVDAVLVFTDSAGITTAYLSGEKLPTDLSAAEKLKNHISSAVATIEEAAGEARARYITVSPGMSAVYLLKKAEAIAYKAAGYPADTTNYPMIAAEANASGATAQVAADTILVKAALWTGLAAKIEDLRGTAKNKLYDSTIAVDDTAVDLITDKVVANLADV